MAQRQRQSRSPDEAAPEAFSPQWRRRAKRPASQVREHRCSGRSQAWLRAWMVASSRSAVSPVS